MSDIAPLIFVKPAGGLGNRMFQHMLALVIRELVPGAQIAGSSLPEWGIEFPAADPRQAAELPRIRSDHVRLHRVVNGMNDRTIPGVLIASPSMRLAYYQRRRRWLAGHFPLEVHPDTRIRRSLVIHVRLNGLAKRAENVHRHYQMLPIAWYQQLLDATGLPPLFVGQFGDDRYSDALRRRFPGAPMIHSADPMEDFRILYSARRIVLSVSSFAWLAAWLSPHTRRIHLPIAGFLHPGQRPGIDLLPVEDYRFAFTAFEPILWAATEGQLDAVIDGPAGMPVSNDEVVERYLSLVRERRWFRQLPSGVLRPRRYRWQMAAESGG